MTGGGTSTPPGRRARLARKAAIVATTGIVAVVAFWLRTRDDSLSRLREAGVIRIGYAVEAPYAFVDAYGGVTGEAPEIARRIAQDLGVARVEWVQTQFDRLIPELLSGRFDVVAAGMFVTPERARRVAFSRPTFRVGPGLLVRADRGSAPTSCAALASGADAPVAVLRGAVEGDALRACGLSADRLLEVPDAAAGEAAVLNDVASGLALSAPTLRWMAAEERPPRTRVIALDVDAAAVGHGAFAFRPGDAALRHAWDEALASFLGTSDHLALVASHGFLPDEVARATDGAAP